jgi:hypothetical protein
MVKLEPVSDVISMQSLVAGAKAGQLNQRAPVSVLVGKSPVQAGCVIVTVLPTFAAPDRAGVAEVCGAWRTNVDVLNFLPVPGLVPGPAT